MPRPISAHILHIYVTLISIAGGKDETRRGNKRGREEGGRGDNKAYLTVDDHPNVGVDGSITPHAAPDVAGNVRSPYRPPVGHVPDVSRLYLYEMDKKSEERDKKSNEGDWRESRGRGREDEWRGERKVHTVVIEEIVTTSLVKSLTDYV